MAGKSSTVRRILREADELSKSPAPDYTASPLDDDLFEWHFTFRGPPNSAYAEGIYHGRIVLPTLYPLRPPSFRFLTPSGRFEVNREICLSISGHHEETWQPAWGLRTALVALRSFMDTDAQGQLGGLDAPESTRKTFATESGTFRCASCAKTNRQIMDECEERCKGLDPVQVPTAGEVEVPRELKMGWRDEMSSAKMKGSTSRDGSSAAPASSASPGSGATPKPTPKPTLTPTASGSLSGASSSSSFKPEPGPDSEAAELAEGFVRTVAPSSKPANGVTASLARAGPATSPGAPQAARRAAAMPVRQPALQRRAPNRRGGQRPGQGVPRVTGGVQGVAEVPLWVDRAIVVLLVVLVALILKVLARGQ